MTEPTTYEYRVDSLPAEMKEVPAGDRKEVLARYMRFIKGSLSRFQKSGTHIDVALPSFISLKEAHFNRALEEVRLVREAQSDELTGLVKASVMGNYYEIARKRLNQESTPKDSCVVIVSFDIDFFRQINETIGHLGADEILKEIGQKLGEGSGNLRAGDICGRVGGDEFVIVLSGLAKSDVEGAIQRIHRLLGSIVRPEIGEVKSSFGALVLSKGETKLFDDARKLSDEATYGVKNYGRNGYTIIDGDQVKIVNKDENGEYKESYQGTEMPKPDKKHRIKEVGNALQRITEEMDRAKGKPCFNETQLGEVESAIETIGKIYFSAKECNDSTKS